MIQASAPRRVEAIWRANGSRPITRAVDHGEPRGGAIADGHEDRDRWSSRVGAPGDIDIFGHVHPRDYATMRRWASAAGLPASSRGSSMPHIVGMEEADGLVVGAMTDRAGTVIPAARRLRTRNFIQLFKPVRLEIASPIEPVALWSGGACLRQAQLNGVPALWSGGEASLLFSPEPRRRVAGVCGWPLGQLPWSSLVVMPLVASLSRLVTTQARVSSACAPSRPRRANRRSPRPSLSQALGA